MQYQIFVQSQNQNGYVAAVIGMPDCTAEGRTEDEAVNKTKAALEERLAQGKIITVEVASPQQTEHPLLKHFGRFKDDSTFDDFLAEIDKYRRELDAEEAARESAENETP